MIFGQDVGEEVVKIQSAMGSGIDVSFDCVGLNKTTSTALNATRSGGKVCLIGLAQSETTVPLTSAAVRYLILNFIKETDDFFPLAFIPLLTKQSLSSNLKAELYCTYVQRSQNFKTHAHFLSWISS